MRKRYQVFVSSTFEDMKEERQAAVAAILRAGHIPAGMELFTSGSGVQAAVIKQWIAESDFFLLLLGGRYGSLTPAGDKSYIEIEFDHAKAIGKPVFSLVLTEGMLDRKVTAKDKSVLELDNPAKRKVFYGKVTAEMVKFCEDIKDITTEISFALQDLVHRQMAGGWVAASDVPDSAQLVAAVAALTAENADLRAKSAEPAASVGTETFGGLKFDEMLLTVQQHVMNLPVDAQRLFGAQTANLCQLVLQFGHELATGVEFAPAAEDLHQLHYELARNIATLGLAVQTNSLRYPKGHQLRLTTDGTRFLTKLRHWAAVRSVAGN